MTDFLDVSDFDRHFNFQRKLGDPGDTEILVSGVERVFTNTIYSKIDSVMSGINEVNSLINITITGYVWDDGVEASGSLINDLIPYISGETAYLKGQAGANTKIITDRIDQVILGQVWKDGVEASGSLINDNLDVKLSTFSGELFAEIDDFKNDVNLDLDTLSGLMVADITTKIELLSGIVGLLPLDTDNAYLLNVSGFMLPDMVAKIEELSGLVGILPTSALSANLQDLSGFMLEDIKDVIIEERDEISGLISILPQNHTALRNQTDLISGALSLLQDELGLETKEIDDKLINISGMISDINIELDDIATQSSLDLVSGKVSAIPNDLSDIAKEATLELVSGMIGDLNLELDGIATQVSLNELSGLVGSLPNDLTDIAKEATVDLVSGMIGILPSDLADIAKENTLDEISGLIGGLPNTLLSKVTAFDKTYFAKKVGGSTGITSGEYVTIFTDSAYANTKIQSFIIDDDGAVNKGMRITDNTTKLFPYEDRIEFDDNTEDVLNECVQILSGEVYDVDVYCEGAGKNATLVSLKIIEFKSS